MTSLIVFIILAVWTALTCLFAHRVGYRSGRLTELNSAILHLDEMKRRRR